MDNQADLLKTQTSSRSKLGRILIFILTLGIGFILGKALYQPEPIEPQELKQTQTETVFNETIVEEATTEDADTTLDADLPPKAEQQEFETPQEVIDYLATLPSTAFWSSPLYRKMQGVFKANPELAYGMLAMLLDISDPQLKVNISSVLNNFLIKSEDTGRVIERPAIDWVLEQIKNQNRPSEWLEVLSHWGAKTKSSAGYLIEQLPLTYSEDQQEDMLSALSIANSMSAITVSKYSISEIDQFSSALAPYLDHKSERIRFAALMTLNAFSSVDLPKQLARALKDDSERIRIRAMDIAARSNRLTPELEASILSTMESTQFRAVERVYAFDLAKQLQLNDKEYERVYKFKIGSLEILSTKADEQTRELNLYPVYYSEY